MGEMGMWENAFRILSWSVGIFICVVLVAFLFYLCGRLFSLGVIKSLTSNSKEISNGKKER